MAREVCHRKYMILRFNLISVIVLFISVQYFQPVSTSYEHGNDTVEPGFLFAKFASKLSELNYRVSRLINDIYNVSERSEHCTLREDVHRKIGPWQRSGSSARISSPKQGMNDVFVTAEASSIFNNSEFGNLMRSRCTSMIGFPECYKDSGKDRKPRPGDSILVDAVDDYAKFAQAWLPKCTVTSECAKVAERARTVPSLVSERWMQLSKNGSLSSSLIPTCYQLANLQELTPELTSEWWFEYCCFTGAICEPFSKVLGWGKLLLHDTKSASQVAEHLQILHNFTCSVVNKTGSVSDKAFLTDCTKRVVTAWNLLCGPTTLKLQSDAIASLVECYPDLGKDSVKIFKSILNGLTTSEEQMIHSMFDVHIVLHQAVFSDKVVKKTHASSRGPIMKRHEWQMTPRAVSGIVVVIVLISLSMLVGMWALCQKIQAWRHPRPHIRYSPIFMHDDFLEGSNEEMETVGAWRRAEEVGRRLNVVHEED